MRGSVLSYPSHSIISRRREGDGLSENLSTYPSLHPSITRTVIRIGKKREYIYIFF